MSFVINVNGERVENVYRGLVAAAQRAGVQNVAPHVLKHTAITWAMQNGVDLWEAAGFLATSVPTLIRVYGHHHPDHMRNAAEAVGRRPGGSRMGRESQRVSAAFTANRAMKSAKSEALR